MEEHFHLECEEAIIWLEDPMKYPYLRVTEFHSLFRKNPPPKNSYYFDRIVGYVTFHTKPEEDCRRYTARRIFGLYKRDLDWFNSGNPGSPCEAIRPETIKVGVWGEK
ncbi:MAG: DUF6009 family protein [Anaerolineaceae bacterium]|nr:DUF6009 family protein [Anaerolineaceae bacterium]